MWNYTLPVHGTSKQSKEQRDAWYKPMLVLMQSLAGINVCTTVRMTVVKLASGGLWVHAPIAPTRQGLLRMCRIFFVLQGLLPCLLMLRWSTARLWCDTAVMSWLMGQCMASSRLHDMLACPKHPVSAALASLSA